MTDTVQGPATDAVTRIGFAWRDLRRGASTAVVRDRMFGTGRDAVEPAQMDVLDLLVVQDERRMSDVAAALRVDPSTVTRTLQRMEAAGLATRVPDTDDGRVVTVRLTPEGRRRHELVADRRTAILTTILAAFEPADRETLADLLDQFVGSLDRYVCDGAPL
jgi:DNA-binding MarR family transcriptional regulator